MNQRNSDVERAVESMDGHDFPYQSFGPLVMRPRNAGELRVFTYNEFGEPEYAPELARAAVPPAAAYVQHSPVVPSPMSQTVLPEPIVDPMYDRLPVMQPPAMRSMPQSTINPPPPRPAMRPIPPVTSPPATQPQMMSQPVMPPPMAAAPVAPPPPVEAAPPPPAPPPFFPLLAAALPNATEPSYTPSYTISPMQTAMGTAAPGGRAGAQATSAAENQADRRSLADMFSLLGARAPAPTGAFPSAEPLPASAPAEAQALFRRI